VDQDAHDTRPASEHYLLTSLTTVIGTAQMLVKRLERGEVIVVPVIIAKLRLIERESWNASTSARGMGDGLDQE
jgi:hypothetical protein